MRISDWSSDVCSSDLWSVFLVSRGTAARRGKKVGQGRCGVPDQRSGLLTDGAFREAVLVRPATGKRRMARPSETKKHRRVRILRYPTGGSYRIAPRRDRPAARDGQHSQAAATPTRNPRTGRQQHGRTNIQTPTT